MKFRALLVVVVLGVAGVFAACAQRGNDGAQPSPESRSVATGLAATAAPTETATPEPTPTPPPPPAALAAGSAACSLGPSASFEAGTSTATITSGGRERTYHIYVPPAYDGTWELPLVLNFHGLGSSGSAQHLYSGLVPVAETEGFFVVSPDGVNNSWLLTMGVNDIQFTRDLVAELSSKLCIDSGAVFSTGMSNGGFMSAALACVADDLVAAVAPVAGILPPSINCGEPVPILEFHGTDDMVVPFAPGLISVTGSPFAGIAVIMAGWGEHNRCAGEPFAEQVSPSVSLLTFDGCEATTAHYVVNGGGHTWPGRASPSLLGVVTQEISAATLIWDFFALHAR